MATFPRTAAPLSLAGLLLLSAALVSAGCSDARRQSIEGAVTLDGQPLPHGAIRLIPREGTLGPTAGATVQNGRFSIDPAKGTFVGNFRVEIVAMRTSGRTTVDPNTGEKIPLREQYLPARYNTNSELTADIAADRPNQLDFALRSK